VNFYFLIKIAELDYIDYSTQNIELLAEVSIVIQKEMLVGCSQCGPLGFLLCGLGIQPISSLPIWALDEDCDGPQKKRVFYKHYWEFLYRKSIETCPKKKRNILKI
jgi:hypothetical protein